MRTRSGNKKNIIWRVIYAALLVSMIFVSVPRANAAITLSGGVKFLGNLAITGALSKSSGTFEIDNPIDPANQILFHSFVESPDAKNLYDGIATLNADGEAEVNLPVYFTALNKDFRYQYSPIGRSMPGLYIKHEISETNLFDNKFVISGGAPNGTISWQVTGNRHDPYILAHPIVPVVEKGPGQLVDKGTCLFEPLCK
jgi:hypothetical protein